jgi:ornithine cyclodeaminase/alanine dehydrogenase-like protein (mu-crystallin family)
MSAIVSRWLTMRLKSRRYCWLAAMFSGRSGAPARLCPATTISGSRAATASRLATDEFAAGFVGLGGHCASAILARAQRRDVRPNI